MFLKHNKRKKAETNFLLCFFPHSFLFFLTGVASTGQIVGGAISLNKSKNCWQDAVLQFGDGNLFTKSSMDERSEVEAENEFDCELIIVDLLWSTGIVETVNLPYSKKEWKQILTTLGYE